MVRGMGKPGGGGADKRLLNTQYCVGCKERKSMTRFDVVHGLCAECSAERGRVRRKSAERSMTAIVCDAVLPRPTRYLHRLLPPRRVWRPPRDRR